MTNHTPTPWFVDKYGGISSFNHDTQQITQVVGESIDDSGLEFESEADLRLILAAPDMYEALERMLDFPMGSEMFDVVASALRKAKGIL